MPYTSIHSPPAFPVGKDAQSKKERATMAAGGGGNVNIHCDGGESSSGGGNGSRHCITEFVDHGSIESLRYYLSRRTLLEMLKDRGYDVADSEITRSLSDFRAEFGDKPDHKSLRLCVSLRSNPHRKMLVIFMGPEEIRTKEIRDMNEQILNKESLNGLILILGNKMNNFARKEVAKNKFKVEIFQITDLLVNVTKHVLQPMHEILNAKQMQQLLKQHNVQDKQLPKMLETDAIVRYYRLEKGQIVKITYRGRAVAVDSLVTYRCVS